MAVSLGAAPVGAISLGYKTFARGSVGDDLCYGEPYEPPPVVEPNLSLVASTSDSLTVTAFGDPPAGFGTVAGFNFYRDGVKHNPDVHAQDTYAYELLDDSTTYALTFTFVNSVGTESDQYGDLTASTLPPPVDPPMSPADRDAIDAIVANAMAICTYRPGVTIAVTGPRGRYERTYGRAIVGGRPLNIADLFRIGSNTKTFVAMAVLLQVRYGNLSLDDKLADFDTPGVTLSDIPNANSMSVRNLLMMQSGVGDYESAVAMTYWLNRTGGPTNQTAALQRIRTAPPSSAPGTAYQYNNANYVLLGFILEAVTGRAIRDIITDDVIVPLGLTETSWPTSVWPPTPFAHGYGLNMIYSIVLSIPLVGPYLVATGLFGGPHRDETDVNVEWYGAAGALVATIGDLTRLAVAHRDHELLDVATYEIWHDPDNFGSVPWPFDGPDEFLYGLGLVHLGSWYGHDGSVFGFNTVHTHEPSSGATIAVMENHQGTVPALAAMTRIFYDIASYLYPGSADAPGYVYEPVEAPVVVLYEETVSGAAIPEDATHWRVRLIPGGSPGGNGYRDSAADKVRRGGGGAGGGAVIDTGMRPIAELDGATTCDLTKGSPGAAPTIFGGVGTPGTASSFHAGPVSLTANPGGRGGAGTAAAAGAGGAGGTAVASGITGLDVQANGTAGAAGNNGTNLTTTAAPNNTAGGAAGGGGGGGTSNTDTIRPGSKGGNTVAQTGGAGGAATGVRSGGNTAELPTGQPGAGGGGAAATIFTSHGVALGGDALGYGGGGGGGGATRSNTVGNIQAGVGGPALARAEFWTIPPREGETSATYGWAGSAGGKHPSKGGGSASYGWSGAAAGLTVKPFGAATGTYGWASAAAGKRAPKASATGTYGWAGGPAGKRTPKGSGTGAYGWAGGAAGMTTQPTGTATGVYGWSSSGGGATLPKGGASTEYSWAATTVGKYTPKASTAGTYGWTTTAAAGNPLASIHRRVAVPATNRKVAVKAAPRLVQVPSPTTRTTIA